MPGIGNENTSTRKVFIVGDDNGDAVRRIFAMVDATTADELLGPKPVVVEPIASEAIVNASHLFWSSISEDFPELTSGDNHLAGEDRSALSIWIAGHPGDYPVQTSLLPIPRSIDPMRVFDSTQRALIAAGSALFGAEISEIPEDVLVQMYRCVCHVIHYNIQDFVDQTDGWFDVLMYESEDDWNSFRASSTNSGIRTFKEAVAVARSSILRNHYEVVVSAEGEHPEFERGERVFYRFHRDVPTGRMVEPA